jgi:hypothetical protein
VAGDMHERMAAACAGALENAQAAEAAGDVKICGVTLTSAPMTPRLVSRRYSNGRVLLVVFRKGYRNSGTCAAVPGRDLLSVSGRVRLV